MEKQNNKKEFNVKKTLKIVGDVLFGLFLVFILFISVTNIRAKKSNGIPNIFGKGYLTVLSDSMDGNKKDSFKVGDLIFVKIPNADEQKNIKTGDIITYLSSNQKNSNGDYMVISHRVIDVREDNGYIFYVTQGDNPKTFEAFNEGKEAVRSDLVLAVYEGKWEGAGYTFAWFGSPVGFFVIVVIPCMLFLFYAIFSFVKTYLEYRNEKKGLVTTSGTTSQSIVEKIRIRKEAFDELVNEGTLTREQADAKLEEYISKLNDEDVSKETNKE